jgi:HD-GYP domain-containing protein (c-di-GMP phosphodiesterase class II)
MTQLLHTIVLHLESLDRLSIPSSSCDEVHRAMVRRVARVMETALPHHFGHGERTASYALALGTAADLTPEQQQDLQYAALLHDIGVLTLPQHLRDPKAPLSAQEYALVQSHSREGAQILGRFRFLQHAARYVAHHHEYWDGSGYPYGLRGDYIPLPARILTIADSFDVLVSQYHSVERSIGVLRASGTRFDPELISLFSQLPVPFTCLHPLSDAELVPSVPSGVGRALPLRAREGALDSLKAPSLSHRFAQETLPPSPE